jgi:hypothetical protein
VVAAAAAAASLPKVCLNEKLLAVQGAIILRATAVIKGILDVYVVLLCTPMPLSHEYAIIENVLHN